MPRQEQPKPPDSLLSRRGVLVAGAGTAAGVTVLAACGGGDGGTSGSTSSGGGNGGGGVLVKASKVPVGGAVSAQDASGKPVIVSQPEKGTIVAFSAICTHQGCTVAPNGGQLKCPCHGSTYDLATGDNTGGPAPRPLSKIPVKVTGGRVVES
ncbi:MAG TPA: Rieske (2Fe-2S) protein [Nocardioidaceae bacterium]|jgi:Rieske Fe-S protein